MALSRWILNLFALSVSLLCMDCAAQFQFGCFFYEVACRGQPLYFCDPGKTCIGINATDCSYICEPVYKGNGTVNENLTTYHNVTGSGTTNLQMNYTSTLLIWIRNQTDDTVSPSLSCADDPSCCSRNYVCKNGGNCSLTELNENVVEAHCQCPKNWTGDFCQLPCTLDCPVNTTCGHDQNGSEICFCDGEFGHPDCIPTTASPNVIFTRPGVEEWNIAVVAALVLLLLLVLTYFGVLKLRHTSPYVARIFYNLQPYEDDDGKLFDVFISFRSTNNDYTQSEDEKFVIHTLHPTLEREFNFKVCVHYRDFMPGNHISDSIIWAVKNSRRTLLVLSPLYVKSNWTRMEWQVAFQEMNKLRHKIIPVIFKDISDTQVEDPTLNHILSSVTYLTYTSESAHNTGTKFWKMLHLALPKLKAINNVAVVQTSL